jgi:hypothetical protein
VAVLQKKRIPCEYVKASGERCNGYRLTREGVGKLLDADISLVADPERFCSYHARTEEERYEMQHRGGSYSAKKAAEQRVALAKARLEVKVTMPRDIVNASQALVRELLAAKIPGTFPPETDVRKAAVGAFVAAHLYAQPDDRGRLAHSLLPRELRHRDDIAEVAEHELQAAIDDLGDAERNSVWQLLSTA